MIQTGEITPFDAINLNNGSNNVFGSSMFDSGVDKYSQIKMRGRKKTSVSVYREPKPTIPKITKIKGKFMANVLCGYGGWSHDEILAYSYSS